MENIGGKGLCVTFKHFRENTCVYIERINGSMFTFGESGCRVHRKSLLFFETIL